MGERYQKVGNNVRFFWLQYIDKKYSCGKTTVFYSNILKQVPYQLSENLSFKVQLWKYHYNFVCPHNFHLK